MAEEPLEDADAMRVEIEHLRTLASVTTDARALAEIQALIDELEYRIRHIGNGRVTRQHRGYGARFAVGSRPATSSVRRLRIDHGNHLN